MLLVGTAEGTRKKEGRKEELRCHPNTILIVLYYSFIIISRPIKVIIQSNHFMNFVLFKVKFKVHKRKISNSNLKC